MNEYLPPHILPEDWAQTPASVQTLMTATTQRLNQLEETFAKVELMVKNEAIPPALILVVDDNQLNRNILTRRLEKQGHLTDIAVDGQDAVNKIEATHFDLVLLDIMMPEMDGYEVLAHLQANNQLRDISVIVITAIDEMQSAVRCIEMGAEDYLAKPFNPALLTARINACLEKKRLRDMQRAYIVRLNSDNERKSAELDRARRVQQAMLPETAPQIAHLQIAAWQQTGSEIGGDYYDFLTKPDDHLWVVVGDATGFGAASGLMVSATKIALLAMNETDVSQQLYKLNTLLTKTKFNQPINIALLLSEFSPFHDNKITLKMIGGGMPPAYIWRKNGTLEEVIIPGLPLGVLSEAYYELHPLDLYADEVILLPTDGLSEMFNNAGQMLGYDHLMAALEQIDALHLTAEDILTQVQAIGQNWAGEHPQADDITLVVVKVTA